MMTAETKKKALILVNRPSVTKVYAYRKKPKRKRKRLTGKNTRMGENKVAMRVIIIKNLTPSWKILMLLCPFCLF